MQNGEVKYWNERGGFGFIQPDHPLPSRRQLYFHREYVRGDIRSFAVGQRVQFDGVVETTPGRPSAVGVEAQ